MKAVQIVELTGPPSALKLVDVSEPEPSHPATPGEGVIVDVHAAGVAFPELLQSRGQYQVKPDLPFIPGSEAGGVVRSAPEGAAVKAGDRVAAFCMTAGWAEVTVAPAFFCFKLPDALDFAQGAALVLNYHTAYFSLKTRGRLEAGETVLVHGAAGGVGTATLQIAKGLGARTIAVVSTEEKERVARDAGADEVVRTDGPWKDQAKEISGGGVDIVIDPVGGDRFTDSLRSLREGGRVVVVGFTGGSIPEVKVNRLLLGNTEVIGAGWGNFVIPKHELNREIGDAIDRLIEDGFVRPVVGARFPLERAAEALELLDSRGATGKVVLELS
ncbi:MAG TPA: NADPH:quinone oxidoreductase family protein [Solirubrobacteraceae bacterium]|jgi:NADPH2:quinone reductase